MKKYLQALCLLIVVYISLACRQTTCAGENARGNTHETTSEEATLRAYLQAMDDSTDTSYVAAFRDLNGDGVDEAIVYLLGSSWCGSGGCSTLILRQEHHSWKLVGKITITRPPIRVLQSTLNGWHGIGVWVQGGGIRRGYEAELNFNGKTYPHNPSVPPARRSVQSAAGETVIAAPLKDVPLSSSGKHS